jgi:phosphomannomutase
MDLSELQNGSDIRGIAIQTENENVNLTAPVAFRIGYSFSGWSSTKLAKYNLRIGIGTDPRISGPELKKGLINGILSFGHQVVDFGLATTPAMFMATQFQETKCDASIMITASHLPFNRNGMKFFLATGGLDKEDISIILQGASKVKDVQIKDREKEIENGDILRLYSDHLLNIIRNGTNEELPLKGQHILVDAGNGSGGFFVDKILVKLGANVTGSLFLEPDGRFPNHEPNPENAEAIQALQHKIQSTSSDLGIIFDTDVDRAAIIDDRGRPMNRNTLIALISAIVLEEHPGSTIVTDSVTSEGLSRFIESKGGTHLRYKRGYKNVINEGKRLNKEGIECWLAIETSGHGAMQENYFLDDGAYLVAKLIIKHARLVREGKSLAHLIKGLQEPIESKEFRIKILAPDYRSFGQQVIDDLKIFVLEQNDWQPAKMNHEGYRVTCAPGAGNGWFLLRLSLHDPVLALNIESESRGGAQRILSDLTTFLKKYSQLETTSLI